MDRDRSGDDLRQGNVNVTSDYLDSWFNEDAMLGPSTPNIYFPNQETGWPSTPMDFIQTSTLLYPRETRYLYIKYFFNLQAHLYTAEPDMTNMDSGGSEIMAYSNYYRPTFCDPKRRPLSPGPAAETDKEERREDLGMLKTSRDTVWQLNQRRPSVIRRSISSDGWSSPREAVLTTTWAPLSTDDILEKESSTQSFTECPPSREAEDEVVVATEPDDSRALSDHDVCSTTAENCAGEASITKSKVHSVKSVKKRRFQCSFCKKRFQWFSHWVAHERIHTGEKPFKCRHCSRAFTRADGLQCHMQTHFKQKNHKCSSIYSKMFNKKTCVKRDVFDHTDEKKAGETSLKCEYCNRQFNDSESIATHLLSHNGEKRFKCQHCNYSFVNAKRLHRHIRGHTGEKPFKCKLCKMAFSKKSALVIHHRVHSGIKPYSCPVCGKSFSISGNLQRHRLIHTGERPYKCLKCQRAFNNPSHLSRHITSQHTK